MFTFRIAIFIKKQNKREIRCQLTREFTFLALIFYAFLFIRQNMCYTDRKIESYRVNAAKLTFATISVRVHATYFFIFFM